MNSLNSINENLGLQLPENFLENFGNEKILCVRREKYATKTIEIVFVDGGFINNFQNKWRHVDFFWDDDSKILRNPNFDYLN
jgi:hypothetical protein